MKSSVPAITNCNMAVGGIATSHWSHNRFMRTVLEEERRAKEIRSQEIQLTKENPRRKEAQQLAEISQELLNLKREEFLEVKRRQQLRANNFDLRQLQIQLQAAHASKELADQMHSVEQERQRQLKAQQEEDVKFEAQRACDEEALRQKELKELQLKQNFRNVLLGQMKEHHERNEKHYEEVLKEREDMQKLSRQLEMEREKEREEKLRLRNIMREEMNLSLKHQEEVKQAQRAAKVDEHDFFLEVTRKRDEEIQQIEQRKREKRERKDAFSEKIGQQLLELQNEQRRREDLLLDLLVEERKAKEEYRYRQTLEKRLNEKFNVRLELQRYREEVLEKKKLDSKKEDELFQKEQMKIMAERDKIEQLSAQRRRQKLQEYKHILQGMIKVRQQQRADAAAENIRSYQYLLEEERKLQEEIEAERLRLLQAQSSEVLRYLPAGVLRESDREKLGLLSKKEKDQK